VVHTTSSRRILPSPPRRLRVISSVSNPGRRRSSSRDSRNPPGARSLTSSSKDMPDRSEVCRVAGRPFWYSPRRKPTGDATLLQRAANTLNLDWAAAAPAERAGLVDLGPLVCFSHPLARAATYRAASLQTRQQVHRALAAVTDPFGMAIGVRGIGPTRQLCTTRSSQPNWSGWREEHWREVASWLWPRLWVTKNSSVQFTRRVGTHG